MIPRPPESGALAPRRRRGGSGWWALTRRRAGRLTPSEIALRETIRMSGGSLHPGRPSEVWRPWLNRALRSHEEVERAIAALQGAGLVPHQDPPKNWDALVALGAILGRVARRAPVLEMGAAGYSPLLRWLYQYGYRHLVGVDLVYRRPVQRGPIRLLPMDLTATGFGDRSFAAIACLSVIEHGVDVEAYLAEASRLLRPGGLLVTSTDFWPQPVATGQQTAYGHPVRVFDRPGIEGFLAAAARHGLRPLAAIDLDVDARVVHWDRVGLDYTFVVIGLVRRPRDVADRVRMLGYPVRDRLP